MNKLLYSLTFSLIAILFVFSCTKKEAIVEQVDQEIFLGVGKWKIKKRSVSSGKNLECNLTDIILNSDLSFKIYFENNNVIVGKYQVIDQENINLNGSEGNLGSISNIQVEDSSISFEIDLTGMCQNSLEGDKDETYQENKTFIADIEFEKYLIEQGWDDVVDNYVLTSNINSITNIYVSLKNISSLIGIEDFTSLEGLIADDNLLAGELNLTFNNQLKFIGLNNNDLKEVKIKSQLLETANLGNNKIEVLEIYPTSSLKRLIIQSNQITSFDFNQYTGLQELYIFRNPIQNLEVNSLNELKTLIAHLIYSDSPLSVDLSNNPNLKILDFSISKILEIDLTKNPLLERFACRNCEISSNPSSIDFTNNESLQYLEISNIGIQNIDVSPINDLKVFRARGNNAECIKVNDSQLANIPPTCQDLDLDLENFTDIDIIGCEFYAQWIFESSPLFESYPSSWMIDESAYYSTNCN